MPKIDAQYSYNFIDLFAGAGGLSEGFLQAGFKPVAHVEMNEFAAKTLETRSAYYYLKGTDNLALYKKYVSGKISRDDFMKQIPASITKTIINETMSDETLPAIFKTIDGIMKIRGMLCTYTHDIYKKFSDMNDPNAIAYHELNVRELKEYFDKQNKMPLKDRVNIILMLFPVNDKNELVINLHKRLWHMQNI